MITICDLAPRMIYISASLDLSVKRTIQGKHYTGAYAWTLERYGIKHGYVCLSGQSVFMAVYGGNRNVAVISKGDLNKYANINYLKDHLDEAFILYYSCIILARIKMNATR